jgi:inositol transport system permease protein
LEAAIVATERSKHALDATPGLQLFESLKKYAIVLVLLAICTISGLLAPSFLNAENLINVVRQVSVITIIAFGETMLIIAGLVDLAPGSVVALSGCVGVGLYIQTHSIIIAIVVAVSLGVITGLVSGLVVTSYGVPSFIMTLAMMTIVRGATFIYTGGFPIYNIGSISILGKGSVLSVPIPVVVMIAFGGLSSVLLHKTRYGRYLYAIGGNENAALAAGINIRRIRNHIDPRFGQEFCICERWHDDCRRYRDRKSRSERFCLRPWIEEL